MARLGFALWLTDHGADRRVAARLAFSRDPDVFTRFMEAEAQLDRQE